MPCRYNRDSIERARDRREAENADRPLVAPASDRRRGQDPEEVTEQVAVRMRLTRVGSTKNPIYRIVVVDSRTRRDGRAIETVGHYNPRTEPSSIDIDADKAKAWLAKGAQPSRTVKRLLAIKGIDK